MKDNWPALSCRPKSDSLHKLLNNTRRPSLWHFNLQNLVLFSSLCRLQSVRHQLINFPMYICVINFFLFYHHKIMKTSCVNFAKPAYPNSLTEATFTSLVVFMFLVILSQPSCIALFVSRLFDCSSEIKHDGHTGLVSTYEIHLYL